MSEFIFLFRGKEANAQSPEKAQQHMQRWMDWMGNLNKAGKLIGAQPLHQSGKLIKGTKKVVTDGPFMEGKELVGGYLLCKAENYDNAVKIAKECPLLEFDDSTVEVREIRELKL